MSTLDDYRRKRDGSKPRVKVGEWPRAEREPAPSLLGGCTGERVAHDSDCEAWRETRGFVATTCDFCGKLVGPPESIAHESRCKCVAPEAR